MKKVYIFAYCNQNIGDDLFVKTLVKRYPKVKFYLFAHPTKTTAFRNEHNLWTPSNFSFFVFRCLNKLKLSSVSSVHKHFIKHCDAVVKIGGSIFIEPKNFDFNKPLYIGYKLGLNTFFIGANFGPYRNKQYLDAVYSQLSEIKDCCFRDTYSFEKFSQLKNVRYAPDVLFGYDNLPKYCKGDGIGISLISFENREDLEYRQQYYYKTLAQLIRYCLSEKINVSLFSFCNSEGDIDAIEKVISLLPTEQQGLVKKVSYNGDVSLFLESFNQCQFVLATRFHAMILGWCMGKKVLPIIYSNKQLNVLNDINYSGNIWDVLHGDEYSADDLLSDCFSSVQIDIKDLSIKSNEQFLELDKFLRSLN